MRPSGMLRGAKISASSRGIFMSRAIASTRPAQRSVRTGPGLTADKSDVVLAVLCSERKRQVLPGGICCPWRDLPVRRFDPVIADQIDDSAASLLLHYGQHVLQATHVTHEFELQRLSPMLS